MCVLAQSLRPVAIICIRRVSLNFLPTLYLGSPGLKYRPGDQNSLGTQCWFSARPGECRDDTSMST
jgi:hypothetical protein